MHPEADLLLPSPESASPLRDDELAELERLIRTNVGRVISLEDPAGHEGRHLVTRATALAPSLVAEIRRLREENERLLEALQRTAA